MLDIVVIGAGPGGIATALAISSEQPALKVAIIESGHQYTRRGCPVDEGRRCRGCGGVCNVISGFGGCMHYGDGVKLSLYPSGRRLADLYGETRTRALSLEAFELLSKYAGDPINLRGEDIPAPMRAAFDARGMDLRPYPVGVVGENNLEGIIEGIHHDLAAKVDIRTDTAVVNIQSIDDGYRLVTEDRAKKQSELFARAVVLATGRRGIVHIDRILERLDVTTEPPTPSIGVRFEMRSSLLRTVGLGHPDLKVSQRHKSQEYKSKSFCFCGGSNGGRIKYTNYQSSFGPPIITLDGHETLDREQPADRELAGNFGLMCQLAEGDEVTAKSFQDQLFGRYREIADGRPITQRLRTFEAKTEEPTGWHELAEALPFEPTVNDLRTGPVHALLTAEQHEVIMRGFRELMAPILDVAGESRATDDLLDEILVIGLEAEFLWSRVVLDEHSQTGQPNLFVVGDAAGYAQGVIQAMVMGLAAGRRIASTLSVPEQAAQG